MGRFGVVVKGSEEEKVKARVDISDAVYLNSAEEFEDDCVRRAEGSAK